MYGESSPNASSGRKPRAMKPPLAPCSNSASWPSESISPFACSTIAAVSLPNVSGPTLR